MVSLYPTTVLEASVAAEEPNVILAGTLTVIPLDMTVSQMVQLNLWQMSIWTEDFSLRAWISVFENGIPYPPGPTPIIRYGGAPIVVYVESQTPPEHSIAVPVPPGVYFLNILNLTNSTNIYGFAETVLA